MSWIIKTKNRVLVCSCAKSNTCNMTDSPFDRNEDASLEELISIYRDFCKGCKYSKFISIIGR